MDDYISKPVKQDMLSAAIERWTLDRSASPRAPEPSLQSSAGVSEGTVIDASVIAELRGLESSADPDFLNRLIDLFTEETPRRLEAVREAAESANAWALGQEAHRLKGSSAHLGARRMAALCEILEEQGRAGSISGAPALLNVLREEFDRVREALEREKKPA
jgi:HPt (histidine-containing phosphotransfer) domain-containing protein